MPDVTNRLRADNGTFVQMPLQTRFMRKVEVDKQTKCWQWIGARTRRGYGAFYYNGKLTSAHRVSYRLFCDVIPAGYLVLHKCDNPPCVNPEHLFVGTQKDNVADMWAKGRGDRTTRFNATKTHCPKGHAYTPDNIRIGVTGRHCRTCEKQRSHHKIAANAPKNQGGV